MDEKKCSRCQVVKPRSDYYVRDSTQALPSMCKECRREDERRRRREFPDRIREIERKRAPKKAHGRRDAQMRKLYGISVSKYNEMVANQCGLCAVCGGEPDGKTYRHDQAKRLVVHHNHDTGKLVALVCNRCNLGMGMFRDDPALMRLAAEINES